MPVYEYKCTKCGEKFEVKHSYFQNKKQVKCPKCGAEDPDRVFSSVEFSKDSCSPRSFG
jgi:putative FmdB family regulatory protein